MCGRAAQTYYAVQTAAKHLHATTTTAFPQPPSHGHYIATNGDGATTTIAAGDARASATSSMHRDNYNMSPGMDAYVFVRGNDDSKSNGTTTTTTGTTDAASPSSISIECVSKVWGIVTQKGTAQAPLPEGMNIHFSNNMFNARSDSLYQRPTYARLLQARQTCLIAVDGFFEWKALHGKSNTKQPYFVYRSPPTQQSSTTTTTERPYLLFAGLWNSVPTARSHPDNDVLHTFTIVTTDVCPSLQWLHTRMPLVVSDATLAYEWLTHPSEALVRTLERQAQTDPSYFQWHAVTPAMSNMKLRSVQAIEPLPQYKTVKSFFAVKKESKRGDGVKDTDKEIIEIDQDTNVHDEDNGKGTEPSEDSEVPEKNDIHSQSLSSNGPSSLQFYFSSSKGLSPAKRPAQSSMTTPSSATKKAKTQSSAPPKKGTLLQFFTPNSK
jgi:putative SOS response-associated peptidase YedK